MRSFSQAGRSHEANQPEAETVKADIETPDQRQFPRPDVLIGDYLVRNSRVRNGEEATSPKGIRVVLAYFRFAHPLKPRWRIMENMSLDPSDFAS